MKDREMDELGVKKGSMVVAKRGAGRNWSSMRDVFTSAQGTGKILAHGNIQPRRIPERISDAGLNFTQRTKEATTCKGDGHKRRNFPCLERCSKITMANGWGTKKSFVSDSVPGEGGVTGKDEPYHFPEESGYHAKLLREKERTSKERGNKNSSKEKNNTVLYEKTEKLPSL